MRDDSAVELARPHAASPYTCGSASCRWHAVSLRGRYVACAILTYVTASEGHGDRYMTAERRDSRSNGDFEPPLRMAVAEYLRREADAAARHEYWHGRSYPRFYPPGSLAAMAGGTEAHDRLIGRLYAALLGRLDGGPCTPYLGNLRLRVDAETYFYPDVYVTCDPATGSGVIEQRDAVLVAEVLSPSTTAFDRGDKLDAYQRPPALREYLLLDSRDPCATLYRRTDQGAWQRLSVLHGADLVLESGDLRLPLAGLYRGLHLDEEPDQA
jgi:Uma2 family endonuclease